MMREPTPAETRAMRRCEPLRTVPVPRATVRKRRRTDDARRLPMRDPWGR